MKLSRLRISTLAILASLPLLTVSSLLSGCANMEPTAPSVPIKTAIGNIQGQVHGGRGPVVGGNVYLFSPSLTGYGGSGIAASSLNASTSLLNNSVPSACGTGATATAVVDTNPADAAYGSITSITVNTGGAGYTANGSPLPPTVTITDPSGDTSATATATLGTYNNVVSIAVANSDNNYTAPVVTITPASTSPCQDANGNYYVTSDVYGHFNLTGDYTCTAGLPVYAYTVGGDSGSGAGINDSFMAILGICPASGTMAALVPFLNMNELSTVAAAYSVAGFATDPLHIGVLLQTTAPAVSSLASLNALEMTGLTNAFNTAGNLYNIANAVSSAPTTTQTTGSTGTILYKNINTLADVLANCINSIPGSSNCTTLLSYTPGQNDTAGAAIYIAQHPASNVANIFGLLSATDEPWTPVLTAAPNDWTISITYTGGGLKSPAASGEGTTLAIDASGNIWNANYGGTTLSKFSNLGVPEGPTATTAYTVGSEPSSATVDISGNVWTANFGSNTLSKVVPTGVNTATVTTVTPTGIAEPNALAFDGSGNMFIADFNNYVFKATSTGAYTVKTTSKQNSLLYPQTLAVTAGSAGTVWVGNAGNDDVSVFTNALATSIKYVFPNTGAISEAVTIDKGGNAWVASYPNSGAGSLQMITSAGVGTTYSPGSANANALGYDGLYLDGGNNVWATDYNNGVIDEINATTGTVLSGTKGFAVAGGTGPCAATCTPSIEPQSIQIDPSGNVWYNMANKATIIEIIGAASPTVQPLAYATTNSLYGVEP